MDLRLSAAEIVLKLSELSAVLLLLVTSNYAGDVMNVYLNKTSVTLMVFLFLLSAAHLCCMLTAQPVFSPIS